MSTEKEVGQMETTMTTNWIAPMGDARRVDVARAQTALRLLAPVCVVDQGTTLSAPAVARVKGGVPFSGGALIGGYAPTTHQPMDVAHIRTGRPPL